jgi:putative ABC transport system permease protein
VIIGVAALVAAFAVTDGVAVWSRGLIMRESSVQDAAVSAVTSVTVNGRTLQLEARSIEAVDTLRAATVDWLAERYGRRAGKIRVDVASRQLENTRMAILLTKLLLGMLVGLALAFGGTAVFQAGPGSGISPVVRPTTAVLAVLSAVAVGLVFGTYPARRAARLSPVEAIARE